MQKDPMLQPKIIPREEVAQFADDLRQSGKRIAFTNGCFDILHIGHVHYLQAARELGDLLIVGLNSDDSVRKLKGPTRPLTPDNERAEILSALSCVDAVVIFPESTPEALISEIKPKVHVKGGDYHVDDLPEAKIVLSYGGDVVIIPYLEGKSTTNIIEKIRQLV
jgi:glycerol-3-phosphate cytidylyltransferase